MNFSPQTTQNLAFLRFLPLHAGHVFFNPVLLIRPCSGIEDGTLDLLRDFSSSLDSGVSVSLIGSETLVGGAVSTDSGFVTSASTIISSDNSCVSIFSKDSPQPTQNLAFFSFFVLHAGQMTFKFLSSFLPHFTQKSAFSGLWVLQCGQTL